jgi:hypothetical protein
MDVHFFLVLFELWGVEEISREREREGRDLLYSLCGLR